MRSPLYAEVGFVGKRQANISSSSVATRQHAPEPAFQDTVKNEEIVNELRLLLVRYIRERTKASDLETSADRVVLQEAAAPPELTRLTQDRRMDADKKTSFPAKVIPDSLIWIIFPNSKIKAFTSCARRSTNSKTSRCCGASAKIPPCCSGSRARRFFGHVPFPLVHVDTTYKIPSMIEYRDRLVQDWKLELVVGKNEEVLQERRDLPERQSHARGMLRHAEKRRAQSRCSISTISPE